MHDTVTDDVGFYRDMPTPDHAADIAQADTWLKPPASWRAPSGRCACPVPRRRPWPRAVNWAEVRPEWGLAGCAGFVAAPRGVTAGADLQGRTFLHSYDWKADKDFATLELILTAPVVVASWINLQYYGSTVAPAAFGGGNKLIHNVVGGIGVVQGNGGILRPGLPWQTLHDGDKLMHEPLRLSVMIEAPRDAITDILERHDEVRALFDNGWLHLFALEEGRVSARYLPGLKWSESEGGVTARGSGGVILEDHVGGLLADHDRGGVGVARDDLGHDRAIGDAQPGDAMHPQPRIDHRTRPLPHPAGAGGVVDRGGIIPRPVERALVIVMSSVASGRNSSDILELSGAWRAMRRAMRMPSTMVRQSVSVAR